MGSKIYVEVGRRSKCEALDSEESMPLKARRPFRNRNGKDCLDSLAYNRVPSPVSEHKGNTVLKVW